MCLFETVEADLLASGNTLELMLVPTCTCG